MPTPKLFIEVPSILFTIDLRFYAQNKVQKGINYGRGGYHANQNLPDIHTLLKSDHESAMEDTGILLGLRRPWRTQM